MLEAVVLARRLDLGAALGGEAGGDGLGRLDQAVLVRVARLDAADQAVRDGPVAVGAVVAGGVAVEANLVRVVVADESEGAVLDAELVGRLADRDGVGDFLAQLRDRRDVLLLDDDLAQGVEL